MKKIIVVLLTILIILGSFVGCGVTENNNGGISESSSSTEITECTISFDTDGGTVIEPIKATYGAKLATAINNVIDPQKKGYNFIGWKLGTEDIGAQIVTSNILLTAVWEKIEEKDGSDAFLIMAQASSYASHYNGSYGGMEVVGERSVKILADKADRAPGFMLTKSAVEMIIDKGYKWLSFTITTSAYASNSTPKYINIYSSGIPADFQLSKNNGVIDGEDVYYQSGSKVVIDLITLNNSSGFSADNGLKFVLTNNASWALDALAAYVTLSNITFTAYSIEEEAIKILSLPENYENHFYGMFGGVEASDDNKVKILANISRDWPSTGFMLKRSAIGKILSYGYTELRFKINISQYGASKAPNYVAIYPSDLAVNNDEYAYYTDGSIVRLDLFELYNNKSVTEENGLKFVLTNGTAFETSASPAYITLSNVKLFINYKDVKLKIATTTGDLEGYYATEEEIIEKLYESGFKYIDFSMYNFDVNSALMQNNWRERALAIKAVADSLGMQFVQAHSPKHNLLASNKADFDFAIAANIRAIEVCEVLGIKNIVVHAGSKGGIRKQEWFAENKAAYEKLLPTAQRCGVNVLCENSTGKNTGASYYINSGVDMREFIEYVNHPNFHGCWDTGHATLEGTQIDDIIALGSEMYAIHLADNLGDWDSHLMPYYGTLDIDEVMNALRAIGYEGYLTLECDGSGRVSGNYTGPQLEGYANPYTSDRLTQEKILYLVTEYMLKSHDMFYQE